MAQMCSWVGGITAGIDEMYEEKAFQAPGKQFMLFMVAMYLGIRGFMDSAQYSSMSPLLQQLEVESSTGQMITSTVRLPWSLKCIYAMFSDSLPVFFYKKRWYMLAATVAGSGALLVISFSTPKFLGGEGANGDPDGQTFMLLFLLVNVMGSLDDCLTQGLYTKIVKSKGASILVFRASMMSGASLIVSLASGVIIDNFGAQWLSRIAFVAALSAIPPIALNMMGDDVQEDACKPDYELIKKSTKIFSLAWALGLTTFLNIGFGLFAPTYSLTRMFSTNLCMMGTLILSFYSVDKRIASINVYLYLCRLCTFGVGYPLQQFYTTSVDDCPLLANGDKMNIPNFPFTIYSTMGGVAANMATFLGLYLFENYLVHWNARRAFWVTTAFQVVAGCFDIVNTMRWNQSALAWTGLGEQTWTVGSGDAARTVRMDDVASFLFGSALLEPLIDQLDSLPSTLLLSKLCPKGVETTMFAILAGFSNVGLNLSGQLGGSAIKFFGFSFGKVSGETICNMGAGYENDTEGFHGLAQCLMIGNIFLPFVTIPLTFCFIPDIRLDEEFLDEGDDIEAINALPQNILRSRSGFNDQKEASFVEARLSLVSGGKAKFSGIL